MEPSSQIVSSLINLILPQLPYNANKGRSETYPYKEFLGNETLPGREF
jgi:hypothetical protein